MKKANKRSNPPRQRPVKVLPPSPEPRASINPIPSGKRWVTREGALERAGNPPPHFVTLWRMMKKGQFPLPYLVGGRSLWLESELDDWQANLPKRKYRDMEVAT